MSVANRTYLLELTTVGREGTPPVVAFVHSSSGSASGFRRLASLLQLPGRYVAFEAIEPGRAERCSVAAIADDYWRELEPVLEQEPGAPLTLVGWSFGGVVSVEIARLAEDAGRVVTGVLLLDAATPRLLDRTRDPARGAIGELGSLFGLGGKLAEDESALADAALAEIVLDRLGEERAIRDLSADDLLPFIRMHRWHVRALSAGWQPRACAARIAQIRAASERGWSDSPDDLGWSEVLHTDVQILRTPGTHSTLMSDGNTGALAELIDRVRRQWERPCQGLPLSSAQARLWFLWQLEPGGTRYNTQFGWRIPDVTITAVHDAWQRLCARQTMLTCSYRPTATGEPRRFVGAPSQMPIELVRTAGTDAELLAMASDEMHRPFDLTQVSARTLIADPGGGVVWLIVTCHHIAIDGWSLGVIEHELRQLLRDPTSSLPTLSADYRDFVAWEREVRARPSFKSQLAYWVNRLDGIQVSPPPPDTFEDATPGTTSLKFALSVELVERLDAAATAAGVTFFTAVLACITIALREWAGTVEVALGVNLANRPRSDLEGVVGLFVNPVVLRLQPPTTGRLSGAVDHVWDHLAAAFDHADVPYQDVVAASGSFGRDAWSPLFWVIVNMIEMPTYNDADGPRWTPVPLLSSPETKFPFAVVLQQSDRGLAIEFLYPRDRYRPSTVERVRRRFEQLVAGSAANGFESDIPPAEVGSSSAADRFSARFGPLYRT